MGVFANELPRITAPLTTVSCVRASPTAGSAPDCQHPIADPVAKRKWVQLSHPGCLETSFVGRMKFMGGPSSYPKELRDRAVRIVLETKSEYPSELTAIFSIPGKLGIGSLETLRNWVRRVEVDTGIGPD